MDIDSIDNESIMPEKVPLNIPELREGTFVFINNKEHPLFLEQGVIVERDHVQYRVKLVSKNTNINDTCIWFPEHWIEPIPKELRRS